MNLSIDPMNFPKIAVRMTIDVNVILHEKAIIRASFYEHDMEFTPFDVKVFIIEGDEYKARGNYDLYKQNIVYEKLGIHKGVMNEEEKNEAITPLQINVRIHTYLKYCSLVPVVESTIV